MFVERRLLPASWRGNLRPVRRAGSATVQRNGPPWCAWRLPRPAAPSPSGRRPSDKRRPVSPFVYLAGCRRARGILGAALRHAGGRDGCHDHADLDTDPSLLRGLYGPRRDAEPLLRLPQPVHLHDADAGDGGQPAAAVLRLGRGRPRQLSAHRLLVRARKCQCRGDEGLHRQPGGGSVLYARHGPHLLDLRLAGIRHHLRRGGSGAVRHLLGGAGAGGDRCAAVPRRHGQIRPAWSAHLAAGCDGGGQRLYLPSSTPPPW